MRVVFMGSPEIAACCLRAVAACGDIEVAGVVTQPDRPRGRKLQVEPCETRRVAMALGLPTYAAHTINDEAGVAQLRAWAPELILVVAFGQILRSAVLQLPRLGCINLHTSLLPALRGAAPIQWAIANGLTETGVTTMFMDKGMDTGDMIDRRVVGIEPEDTGGTLHDRLASVGADLLVSTVYDLAAGRAVRTPQDHAGATYARKLAKQDGRLAWSVSARDLHNRVRGFNPWPCCHCLPPGDDGSRGPLRVLVSRVEAGIGPPGELIDVGEAGPLVACGTDALRLVEVQPAGKRRMSGSEFLRGHRIEVGEQFQ